MMKKHLWQRLKSLLIGVAGFFFVLLMWSFLEPYHLDEQVVVAEISSLPQSWQEKRIAVIADFQVGMWMANTKTIEHAIAQIIKARPAVTLIAGDFVYKPGETLEPELDQVIDLVQSLTNAQIPTYAVLGNHDYGIKASAQLDTSARQRAAKIQRSLESIGVRVLNNEAIALRSEDQTSENEAFYLVGIGAYIPGQSQPLDAIAQVPDEAARFVLMHNPASFAELPSGTAPVAVAGHTHGGQVRIPFRPHWSWMTLVEDKPSFSWISQIKGGVVRVSGWIPGYGSEGNHLYINRGIGFSHLPIRFNCPPELTLFTLLKKG
jgi:uncharacterized protein